MRYFMIYYPKTYGTCSGANKAINLAYKLKKDNKDKNIVIYKEILHNPYVIKELKKDNIICKDNLEDINKNDIVIAPIKVLTEKFPNQKFFHVSFD